MDRRLSDILHGNEDNYLFPFYWQRGDHTERIGEQIQRIYESGCRAICVESRPHPDFCGERWWRDFGIILEEARRRDMTVWLLDDDKFPTGHAAGMIAKKHPELAKWMLVEHHVDVVGPAADIALLHEKSRPDHELIGVYAYKRRADAIESSIQDPIDLTALIDGDYLYWSVPSGVWRVFFYYRSRRGAQPEYIDMINPDSVRVLIDAVYESHYEHFGEYFGNTFVGFFSDEPCFGNQIFGEQRFDFGFYEAKIGKPSLALPWNDAVRSAMTEYLGFDPLPHLNLLWYEDGVGGDLQSPIRYAYMDAITKLYSECFNRQLSEWCHAHGVMYIGHIIEDMNCGMRRGVGHYFRALKWQDMSGIDVVLHQIMPGMEHFVHTAHCATGVSDGTFFHYILAKLGASLAHLTPEMHGRAMCEVFGAYGYGEDTPLMKYLIDHLLVRGINHFVPHAFSSKYPDKDCPPHFGAEGHDPSLEAFGALMRYTNKASHLLTDLSHIADVALLYHADSEWSSRFMNAMNMQPAAKTLYDAHFDYDIVCADMLESAEVHRSRLVLSGESFGTLIVPYADHIPSGLAARLSELAEKGLEIIFIDALPENARIKATVLSVDALIPHLRTIIKPDVCVADEHPMLRIFHGVRDGNDIFMIFNESVSESVSTSITLPCRGEFARLDLATDLAFRDFTENGTVEVKLLPIQSLYLVFGDAAELDAPMQEIAHQAVTPHVRLELADSDDLSKFTPYAELDELINVTSPKHLPDFSGKMKYTFTIDPRPELLKDARRILIDLGRVGQNASLRINGEEMGIRFCAPYAFDITDALKRGARELEVVVSNTVVQRTRDDFSYFLQLSPSGLLGGLSLCYYA